MGMEIKPQAVVIPKETDHLEQGKYGPIFPKTPACYGFTIIAKVKPGRAETIRNYGSTLANGLEADPYLLAPLKLHYLRWVLFDNDTRFMYQGIFDTDFDKYTEDAIALFTQSGVNTVFENLEGFPMDWKTNPEAFIKLGQKRMAFSLATSPLLQNRVNPDLCYRVPPMKGGHHYGNVTVCRHPDPPH
jgi:hypothetical protein